jgi:hypothetical protein
MIYSASPLIKILFLFSFSFTGLLVFSSLLIALFRNHYAWASRKNAPHNSAFHSSDFQASNFISSKFLATSPDEQNLDSHSYDKVSFLSTAGLLISLGCSLIFTSFFVAQYAELFVLFTIAICLFYSEKKSSIFSLYLSHEKLPFRITVWSLLVALFCLGISYFLFSESSLFLNYFPFWADRLLGACLLFSFVLLFQTFSSERFGLHVSFGAVALSILISFIGFNLANYWLDLAFVFTGLSCASLYWVICFGPYKIDKSIRLALGFFLGVFLLKLMTLGAILPPLFLLLLGLSYLLYPHLKKPALKIQKMLFRN